MPSSRLDCPLSLKTPNMGNIGLGTLPSGTTEAQVDDMMMVLEVAGEATPSPKPA